jgi:hypothetical protein
MREIGALSQRINRPTESNRAAIAFGCERGPAFTRSIATVPRGGAQ